MWTLPKKDLPAVGVIVLVHGGVLQVAPPSLNPFFFSPPHTLCFS